MDATKSPAFRQLPNCITSLRILATAWMLFVPPMSREFFILFTLAGVTDVLDGWLARRMNLSSDFGAKLDSAADLMFYTVMFFSIFPALWAKLPRVIWLGVATVVALRLICYGFAAWKYRRFTSMHTLMNKLTGFMMFVLPYMTVTAWLTPFCWALFGQSLLAAVEEFVMHIRAKEYDPNVKSLFLRKIP